MKILIVEDETEMAKTLETSLEQSGYRVETAADFRTTAFCSISGCIKFPMRFKK